MRAQRHLEPLPEGAPPTWRQEQPHPGWVAWPAVLCFVAGTAGGPTATGCKPHGSTARGARDTDSRLLIASSSRSVASGKRHGSGAQATGTQRPARKTRVAGTQRPARKTRVASVPRRHLATPLSRPRKTVIRLVAAGDVMFGRYRPNGRYSAFGRDKPFRAVAPLIRGHDIALVNLETPIASRAYVRPYRGLTFRAPPRAARLLAQAGFTVVSLANNHAFDQGPQGVLDTLTHLKRAGLGVTGTGRTPDRAWAPYVYQKRGVRVAVLAVSLLRNYPPRTHRAHWTYVPIRRAHEELPRRIAALRPRFDFIVLSLHFGVEYYQTIGRFDRTLVDKLVQAGVDVLVGHHPHVLRPVVHMGKAVAFYSLGNFLFDYQMKGSEQSALAELELIGQGAAHRIGRVRIIPIIRHWRRIPVPATGRTAARIRRTIRRITARYHTGTRFRRDGEALLVAPAAPPPMAGSH